MTGLKLGRLPSPKDHRDLRAASYLQAVPDPPAKVNYAAGVNSWAMFANDRVGDCTIASMGHQIQVWTRVAQGKAAKITNPAILKRYEEVSGYVPGDESTDVGGNERDVLKLWTKQPFMGVHTLTAFAAVKVPDPTSTNQMKALKQALWLGGGLYIGLDLPLSAQAQIKDRRPWTTTVGPDAVPGSWGGHAVNLVSYDVDGLQCITWGRRQLMSWSWLHAYCSEAWLLISASDWLNAGKSPGGFNLNQLEADLAALRSA